MKSALIVVDMLNTYEHEDADRLTDSVRAALPGIETLIERARRENVPIVYVNGSRRGRAADDGAQHGRRPQRRRAVRAVARVSAART